MQPTSSHPGPAPDPGLSPLKRAFLALESSQQRVAALERAAKEPIAVIGIGCRVPGADNPDAFWRLMRDGVDAISTVPPDRFDIDTLFDPDPEASGCIATRYGGFIRSVDQFDCGFFGIAPREAQGIDPQQRLLLEVSWEALENAGQAPMRLETSKTGVYFGLCTNDYSYLQVRSGDPALLNAHFGIRHSTQHRFRTPVLPARAARTEPHDRYCMLFVPGCGPSCVSGFAKWRLQYGACRWREPYSWAGNIHCALAFADACA